jgi:PAS domain S-box-containing protein
LFFAEDVTASKNAEKALRLTQEKYHRLFEEDIAGNYVAAPDGGLLACNTMFARMFGFASAQEALAQNLMQLYSTPSAQSGFLDVLRQQRKLMYHEKELYWKGGGIIHVIENAIGTFDEKGELVEIQGHLIDDTEGRLKERALSEQA